MEDSNKENKIKNSEEIIDKRKEKIKSKILGLLKDRSNFIFRENF
jgi:hypothetical protein